MKIQLLSDLHLEANHDFAPTPAPGADILVLAGDIGSYRPNSSIEDDDFGLERFSPLRGWPTPVYFVPGNHEYDAFDFDVAHRRMQASCERQGIEWLDRREVVFERPEGRIRMIGTALWTDFDALAKNQNPSGNALARSLAAREKAFRAANFYLQKTGTTRNGVPMLAQEVREEGLDCQQWLTAQLEKTFDGKTVVVTHFAPSLSSADPRFGLTPGTAGFCNALDSLLPMADVWMHGHLHCRNDYVQNGCRVVANPLGYAQRNEQEFFNPTFCVDV